MSKASPTTPAAEAPTLPETSTPAGFHPPQQARTRRVVENVLAATAELLETVGPDDLTMAAVAEQADVSIGALYRRFEGREQLLAAVKDGLLTEFETSLSHILASDFPDLSSLIKTYADVICAGVSSHPRAFPALLAPIGNDAIERGHAALANIREQFLDAASAHLSEIRHPEPHMALAFVQSVIISSVVHRGLLGAAASAPLTWQEHSSNIADMAIAFLGITGEPQ